MTTPYDSRPDTEKHIEMVRLYMGEIRLLLFDRAVAHDSSKLVSPEKEGYDLITQRLAGLTYGSDEYRASLKALKPTIDHHYANNSHHPEHYENGVADFDLLDLVEMLCDWQAASLRHDDGDILKSIEINIERFKLDPQLASILRNTVERLGWTK